MPAKIAARPAPRLDPAVAKRRAEILGTAPAADAGQSEPAPAFMAPRLRRAQLHRLAEDMEIMFVDNTVR